MTFDELEKLAHNIAVRDGTIPTTPENALLLMISEIGEAVEAIRRVPMEDDHDIPEFAELEMELADMVIRVMVFSHEQGYRLYDAIDAKLTHKKLFPSLHKKKF